MKQPSNLLICCLTNPANARDARTSGSCGYNEFVGWDNPNEGGQSFSAAPALNRSTPINWTIYFGDGGRSSWSKRSMNRRTSGIASDPCIGLGKRRCGGGYPLSSWSSAFASFKSAVSNPSVNQL